MYGLNLKLPRTHGTGGGVPANALTTKAGSALTSKAGNILTKKAA